MAMVQQKASGTDRWVYALAYCLGYISENPDKFQKANRAVGFAKIAEHLNKSFAPAVPFTPQDLKTKIQDTWQKCGYSGDDDSENLYTFGVQWRTLPGLEQRTDVSFEDVRRVIDNCRSQNPQYCKTATVSTSDKTGSAGSRYPIRANISSNDSEMKCICPFDTENGHESVQCDSCKKWQHVFCYYLLSLVDSHFCIDCCDHSDRDQEESFETKAQNSSLDLAGLQALSLTSVGSSDSLQFDNTVSAEHVKLISQLRSSNIVMGKQITSLKRALELQKSLSTFTSLTSNTDELFFEGVPDDSDIINTMSDIEAILRPLIITFAIKDYWVDISRVKVQKRERRNLKFMLSSYLPGQTLVLSKSLSKTSASDHLTFASLLTFLVWSMVSEWVFEAKVFSHSHQDDPMSAAAMDVLRATDGDDVVHRLELAACSRLLNDKSGWFTSTVEDLAEDFSTRSLNILSDLVRSFCFKADEQLEAPSLIGGNAKVYLAKIFGTCLTLKAKLSMRRSNFRVDIPWPGDFFDATIMEDINLTDIVPTSTGKSKVRPCINIALCPTIMSLEDPSNIQEDSKHDMTVAMLDRSMRQHPKQKKGWNTIVRARVILHKRAQAES